MNKVLIIEGEEELRALCARALKDRGIECLEASDGVLGCNIFFNENPDLVILDLLVPRMDGRKILNRIAEHPLLGHVPKVLLSSMFGSLEEVPKDLSELGVVHVIRKPFDEKMFAASIEDLLHPEFLEKIRKKTDKQPDQPPVTVISMNGKGEDIFADLESLLQNASGPVVVSNDVFSQLDPFQTQPTVEQIVLKTDLPALNTSDMDIFEILDHTFASAKANQNPLSQATESDQDLNDIDLMFNEIRVKKTNQPQEILAQENVLNLGPSLEPSASFSEEICPFFFPRLLSRIFLEKLTGILILNSEEISKKIYVHEGHLLQITSNIPDESLDEILTKMKVLTDKQLSVLGAIQEHKEQEWAENLLRYGFMLKQDLQHYLELQRKLRVLEVFRWDKGIYEFKATSYDLSFNLPYLRIPDIIHMGIQKFYDRTIIEKLFNFRPETRLMGCSQTLRAKDEMTLSSLELTFLSQIDNRRTIEDMVTGSQFSLEAAYRFAATLFYLKFIRVHGAVDREEAETQHEEATLDFPVSDIEQIQLDPPEEHSSPESSTPITKPAYEAPLKPIDKPKIETTTPPKAKDPKPPSSPQEAKKRSLEDILSETTNLSETGINLSMTGLFQGKPFTPPQNTKAQTPEEHFEQGKAFLADQKFSMAIWSFRQACQLNENVAAYFAYLGWALFKNSPHSAEIRKKAKRYLKKAIQINSSDPDSLYFLAVIFEKDQEFDKAMPCLEKVVRLDPRNAEALRLKRTIESRLAKTPPKRKGLASFFASLSNR